MNRIVGGVGGISIFRLCCVGQALIFLKLGNNNNMLHNLINGKNNC
jgi:hypothetical protein